MMHGRGSIVIRWIGALARSRLVRDRRSTVAAIAGLAAIPMVLTAGLALDGTRIWLLQTRLQEAVDATVLLAASPSETSVSTAQATTDASNLFWANFGRASRTAGNAGSCSGSFTNTGFMGAYLCDTALSVTFPDINHVQVSATATLPLTFMQAANLLPGVTGFTAKSVSASGTAQRAGGVEMALVLDISLSMQFPMGDGTGNNKEQALQAAAASMLSALYGSNTTVPNLYVSVVPFAGAVNIGSSHTSWLDSTFTSGTYKGSTADGSGWRGCVEARQGNNSGGNSLDLAEDNPTTAPFAPFYWASTYHQYPNPSGGYFKGDNDWTAGTINDTNSSDQTQIGTNIPQGPNLGCPHTTLLPLTASETTISNAINSFKLANPIGTVVVQGLQWGWFTLSPSWQGSSGWNLTTPGGTALPLNYAAPNNRKVIVLMTDGTSDVSGAETFYGAANSADGSPAPPACNQTSPSTIYATTAPECIPTNNGGTNTPKSPNWNGTDADSWYSPYGRVSAARVLDPPPNTPPSNTNNPATDSGNATQQFSTLLDSKVTDLCNNIRGLSP